MTAVGKALAGRHRASRGDGGRYASGAFTERSNGGGALAPFRHLIGAEASTIFTIERTTKPLNSRVAVRMARGGPRRF
jgi:hypothetical protein